MGRDKALLPWDGGTLLDHALRRLQAVCPSVRILAGPGARYEDRGVPVVVDVVSGAGPLGALHAGLSQPGLDAGLFLGVDLPFVPVALLRQLLDLLEDHDAVVPLSPAGPEPLCAVYRASCLEAISRRLQTGERKATSFWPDVHVREVDAAALTSLGPLDLVFGNLNTPGDYDRARERAAR